MLAVVSDYLCLFVPSLQAKAIHLTNTAFTIANGLLTPTMKISRANARRRFASVTRQLYLSGSHN